MSWANVICKLALTAPVTTASNERAFSKIKIMKNHLRSNMAGEILNSFMLLSTEKDLTDCLILCDIVGKWSVLKQRRIFLYDRYYTNIL